MDHGACNAEGPSPHLVQFFETDDFLCDTASEFLLEGLRGGEPVVAIATEAHRDGIVRRLRDSGIDLERAQASGRVVLLDAKQTLELLMTTRMPDAARFHAVIGNVFDTIFARTGAPRARAYGELVDLLWRDGRLDAALRLEELWTDLARTHRFALLRASLRELRALRCTEEASRLREQELREFLDEAVVAIHTVDANGIVTWANRAELAMLGYRPEEYIGQHASKFHLDAAVSEDYLRRLHAAKELRNHELRVRARDGSIRHLLISANVYRKDGELVSARCFSRDITERKRGEQERDRLIADLTRTVRLNEMFASVLGHDLRSPLNTITLTGQLMIEGNGDPGAVRRLQRLLDSAGRMQRMIDQLLDFSRARAGGGIPLETKPHDLGAIARDVVDEMRVAHPNARIVLTSHGDLRGHWDANRLAQVFSNLVGNAVQHGFPGAPIEVRLDGATDPVRVEIENRGTIGDDVLPLVFSPFRGKHQRGRRSQGLGLGLFITDQIVRAHGGSIEVASSDGTTRFALQLPRRGATAAAFAEFATTPHLSPDHARPAAHGEIAGERRLVGAMTDQAFDRLVTSIRDYAVLMLDARGYIMSWNIGAQLISGYTGDEVIGRHISLLYPREDIRSGNPERELEVAAREGQYEDSGWRVRKDGTPFWTSLALTAIRDDAGTIVGYSHVARDLTEERQAQEAAKQSEERFRLLVEGVKEYAIFMLDPEGHVATWNAGAERIKGYRADEIIGKHFALFYPPEDIRAGKIERELEGAIRDGRFEDEGWRVRKDGSMFWANVVITALRDEHGQLVGFAKVTRDLTERRKHEEERVRLAHALEAVRLRDEFLSIASHELKTPLTVLRLQLEALDDRLREVDAPSTTKLARANRASRRLSELVETLLDVSRIATGRFELRRESVDLAEVARESVDHLRDAAEAAGCDLRADLAEGVVGMYDRSRIDQAITNMIANAIKYAAGAPIEISLRRDHESAWIEVRDHGPGLPEGHEDTVFERFERAAPMQNYGGLGLGLYVVSQIAEAHGGSATAANASGGGACFRVRIPLVPPEG